MRSVLEYYAVRSVFEDSKIPPENMEKSLIDSLMKARWKRNQSGFDVYESTDGEIRVKSNANYGVKMMSPDLRKCTRES